MSDKEPIKVDAGYLEVGDIIRNSKGQTITIDKIEIHKGWPYKRGYLQVKGRIDDSLYRAVSYTHLTLPTIYSV